MIDDEPDLERGKVYKVLPDLEAEQTSWLRIVDESREDYLYPANGFVFVEIPQHVQQLLSAPAPRIERIKSIRQRSTGKNA